jgi:hypothetical protein
MSDRVDPDLELLWEEFHRAVNMTSDELRIWLLTETSGEEALPAEPDLRLPELGARVVALLRKRKVDLTGDDVETMRQVVDQVDDRLADRPPEGASDDKWRRSLMDLGHDPLKP